MRLVEYRDKLHNEWRTLAFWRDVCVEVVATFMLVSVQCILPLTWGGQPQFGSPVHVGVAMGFIVATMAWTLGDFSGGHMNPAVTFGFAVSLKITFIRALFYIIAQCGGGIAGAAFVYAVIPEEYREGISATKLHPDLEPWQGFLIEMWITMGLVITIYGSVNLKRKGELYMNTIPIGFAIALGIMSAFSSTGGSMNPARSLGPAVMMNEDEFWDDHWVYWVGPLCGSGLASVFYWAMFDQVKDAHYD